MAYSNNANTIYEAIKVDINTEIIRCEIENRDKFPEVNEASEFVGKYGKGIIIRIVSDTLGETGSGYEDRRYTFILRAYISDPGTDQKDIMDFAEHIKYALQQNKTVVANSSYHIAVNIEYIEPETEEKIKRADLTLEVLQDG
jgi:hypothetical protein